MYIASNNGGIITMEYREEKRIERAIEKLSHQFQKYDLAEKPKQSLYKLFQNLSYEHKIIALQVIAPKLNQTKARLERAGEEITAASLCNYQQFHEIIMDIKAGNFVFQVTNDDKADIASSHKGTTLAKVK